MKHSLAALGGLLILVCSFIFLTGNPVNGKTHKAVFVKDTAGNHAPALRLASAKIK